MIAREAARREASTLLRAARADGSFAASLPRARDLAAIWPEDAHLAHVVGHLLDGAGDAGAANLHWRRTVLAFPGSVEAFAQFFRGEVLRIGKPAAAQLLARMFPEYETTEDRHALLMAAIGLEALQEPAPAERLYRRLVEAEPSLRFALIRLAVLIEERGAVPDALALLDAADTHHADPQIRAMRLRLRTAVATLSARYPGIALNTRPAALATLDEMLAEAVAARRATPPRSIGDPLGKVVLVTGSLGGGGAERQLVATARALRQAALDCRTIAGVRVAGPVAVIARRLDPRGGHDFFLKPLVEAGIPVTGYMSAPRFGGARRHSVLADRADAAAFLPVRIREGVERLTELLRFEAPDVVHIWQDGMIVAASLAALLAGVPRIVLNVRTLPPSARADRWKPEQEPLYRALLACPGVQITANSAIAARAYERWLGLAEGMVAVVPNGVAPLDQAGSPAEEARWAAFDAAIGAGFTVGGVMRFDGNKRPFEWLGIAEAFAHRHPSARFVLVGDGPLGGAARELAAQRGLGDRILFAGRSPHVGFWLSKLDAFLLTSRHEGTPNVLIEAQHAGVPVVTTPAGAAAETILPGISGFVLDETDEVDIEAAAAYLATIAGWSAAERAHVAAVARQRAGQRYSPAVMLRETVENFTAPFRAPIIA